MPVVKRRKEKADPNTAKDGTDLTLIRWMLSLTPLQRLQVLQNQINGIARLRRGQLER